VLLAASVLATRYPGTDRRGREIPVTVRDSMCDPQHGDVSSWEKETTPGITYRHPPDYVKWVIDPRLQNQIFTYQGTAYPPHTIQAGWAQALDSLDYGLSRSTRLSICTAVIGGRVAFIATYARGMNPTLAVARWSAHQGLPPAYLAISARDRSALGAMRQLFWTAHFSGLDADSSDALLCATPILPRGQLGDLLDTPLVAQLGQNLWAAMPRGHTVLEISFGSAGAVEGVEVLAGDLPENAEKQIASLVASNVRPQPALAPRAGVRVEVTESGFSYQLTAVSACPEK